MTIGAFTVGVLVVLAALVLLERRASRRQPVPNPDLLALVGLIDRLCQRIQAPAQAVFEHSTEQVRPGSEEAPPAVHPDNDADFWEAREALAERLMAEENRERDATHA